MFSELPSLGCALLSVSLLSGSPDAVRAASSRPEAGESLPVRPCAVVRSGGILFAAARDRGAVLRLDPDTLEVLGEERIGKRIEDLAAGGSFLLASDSERCEIVQAAYGPAGDLRVVGRLRSRPYPSRVAALSGEGARFAVSLLWARRVVFVTCSREGIAAFAHVDLPFAPGELLWVSEHRTLVVADAFGGRLALVDIEGPRFAGAVEIEGHNIGGLALRAGPDGDELLIAHQILTPFVPTETARITWGAVIANVLRAVRWRHLEERARTGGDDAAPIAHWTLEPLGGPGRGAADPGRIVLSPDGSLAVLLRGVGEVAIRRPGAHEFSRIACGRGPSAVALGGDGKTIYVAATYDDRIARLDLRTLKIAVLAQLGEPDAGGPEARGEALFHDARIGFEGWYSCSSCHVRGHTNGLLNDNLDDGSYGTPKLTLSLFGSGSTGPWSWSGEAETLEEQIRRAVRFTLRGPEPPPEAVADLAAFVRSLPPAPGIARARGEREGERAGRGRELFDELDCGRCHHPPSYTIRGVRDVGTRDEDGRTRFNPPSLLGVSQRGPYLHDGSARDLRALFSEGRHRLERPLAPAEIEALAAFLRGL